MKYEHLTPGSEMIVTGRRPSSGQNRRMRHELHQRDGANPPCHWCKVEMIWEAPYPERIINPKYATIEHVIPLGEGGKHALANCVFACLKCNNDRSKWHIPKPKVGSPNKPMEYQFSRF